MISGQLAGEPSAKKRRVEPDSASETCGYTCVEPSSETCGVESVSDTPKVESNSDSESTEGLAKELSDENKATPCFSEEIPSHMKVPENTPCAGTPKVSDAGNDNEPYLGITTQESGDENSPSYKVEFLKNGKVISPWHDIPLYAEGQTAGGQKILNFICEIPKGTKKKFEISRTIKNNPIVQDKNKDGSLRSYKWPELRPQMYWNYGALPQTWENPEKEERDFPPNEDGSYPCGDNDPLDAIEIGSKRMGTGEIRAVKVLGVLAMIDSKETDWKIIVARVDDDSFEDINTLKELEDSEYGKIIGDIRTWLTMYKTPAGKPMSEFGFEGKPRCDKYALSIVEETNEAWARNTKNGTVNRELDSR